MARCNEQFGRPAAQPADAHRAVSDERVLRALSLQEIRVAQPDWTIRWHNGFLQLPRATAAQVQPGQRVEIRVQLDSRLRIFVGECELPWSTVREAPPFPLPAASPSRGPTGSSQGQKPRVDHPWRGRKTPHPQARRRGVGLLHFGRCAPFVTQSNTPANPLTQGDILVVYNNHRRPGRCVYAVEWLQFRNYSAIFAKA